MFAIDENTSVSFNSPNAKGSYEVRRAFMCFLCVPWHISHASYEDYVLDESHDSYALHILYDGLLHLIGEPPLPFEFFVWETSVLRLHGVPHLIWLTQLSSRPGYHFAMAARSVWRNMRKVRVVGVYFALRERDVLNILQEDGFNPLPLGCWVCHARQEILTSHMIS